MKEADFLGSGWKYPVEVQDTGFALSSGDQNIKESILIILQTAKGERVMRPDFGCEIQKLAFETLNTSTTTLLIHHIKQALLEWESRITVKDVLIEVSAENDAQLNIKIDYVVISSNSSENLVYPFFLENR